METVAGAAVWTLFAANSGGWYSTLNKPAWNPPAWLFGPVWTLLYAAMAVAAWLVWRRGGWREQRRPLVFFLVQLALLTGILFVAVLSQSSSLLSSTRSKNILIATNLARNIMSEMEVKYETIPFDQGIGWACRGFRLKKPISGIIVGG